MGFSIRNVDPQPIQQDLLEVYKGDSVGEIHELVVDPEFQDRGIGKRLLLTGLEVLIEKGCRRFSLWGGKRNIKAQTLYGNLGFRIEGQGNVWVRMVIDQKG